MCVCVLFCAPCWCVYQAMGSFLKKHTCCIIDEEAFIYKGERWMTNTFLSLYCGKKKDNRERAEEEEEEGGGGQKEKIEMGRKNERWQEWDRQQEEEEEEEEGWMDGWPQIKASHSHLEILTRGPLTVTHYSPTSAHPKPRTHPSLPLSTQRMTSARTPVHTSAWSERTKDSERLVIHLKKYIWWNEGSRSSEGGGGDSVDSPGLRYCTQSSEKDEYNWCTV